MKKWILNSIKILVSIALLLFLFSKIGVRNVYVNLININIYFFLVVVIILILDLALVGLILKIMLKPIKPEGIIFKKLFLYSIITYSVSRFAPGRIGDISMVYLLNKSKVPIGKASALVLLDKIVVFSIYLVFSLFGFFIFFPHESAVKMAFFCFGIIILGIFVLNWSKGREILKKHILKSHAEKFSGFYSTLRDYVKKHKKILLIDIFLSLIKVFLMSIMVYFAFMSANYYTGVSIINFIIICSIGNIISLIPVTMSGVGARESFSVFAFSQLGVPAEITMSAYIILLFIRYAFSGIFLLFYTWSQKH
ncbi:MAG: lysylphosphatidylglycerol synthase transmembrane domain-containing protein [Candidatus Nanoarchaeia archaeon]|nr:lysylphosphatidylglycerol synthase transmembrane domain-containing protein [Candidatus Nanoarchaeia archaeon]